MAQEIAALERTGTWDVVTPPSSVRPITCKWVYKIKNRSDGSLERYKARLVARGFQKEHGRDYDETFAPVTHMTTVRTLLAVASVRHWSVCQLDVQNAFLNGELTEELQTYSDATWASDPEDRKSLSAYCVFLGGSLIAWKTKKQVAVSRSSVEAELQAMALLTAEVTWLRWLLAGFGVSADAPTPLLSDSTGAIIIARDPVKHELTKHIGVDAFYVRHAVQEQARTPDSFQEGSPPRRH
ncbi:uncharacterized protein [Lolium perenne]|uniref:uncharacterized protein n=1 Tax=Lolium perenne TaxID=4522 RepID=UPI003A996A55